MESPKSVIILGGSLGGLMHALVLLSLPDAPQIRILERSPLELLHNQGAGIVALNETQEFFEKHFKPGRDYAITAQLRHYLDQKGEIIRASVEHRQQRMTSWDLVYHLLRWRVDGLRSPYVEGLIADGKAKAKYKNGCTVTNIENLPDGVKVSWDHKDLGPQAATADLVIASDGASSKIRRLLRPDVERKYAGYVAWRGTVPESQLSDLAKKVFLEKFTFFHSPGTQTLGYLIPGSSGTLEPGERLFNWVWYCNYEEGSPELEELMTDVYGKRHAITLPVDTMQPDVWEKQKAHAAKVLPPQYAEAVQKTGHPFIQAITDNICDQNSFFEDKVLLVGDALAGLRPHTAASTAQAAYDAMELGKLLKGELSKQEYDESVIDFATRVQKSGVVMGERSQFGRHPFAS